MMAEKWIKIPCKTLLEAVRRAVATTGNTHVYFDGDFGQDEGAGEVGMGGPDYSIVVWPNGTAILTVRDIDNFAYIVRDREEYGCPG